MKNEPLKQNETSRVGLAFGLPRYITFCVGFLLLGVITVFAALNTTGAFLTILTALAGAVFATALLTFYQVQRKASIEKVVAAAIDNSAEAVFITAWPVDGETPLVYANPAFHSLFPTRGDYLGALEKLLKGNETALDEFDRLRATANANGAGHSELSIKGASGALEWRRVSVQPFHVPGTSQGHVLWRSRDITARREMDVTRAREGEIFADFLENLPAAFFSSDADGNIKYANNKFVEWLGVSAEDLRAQNMRFSDFVVAGSADAAPGSSESGASGDVTLRGPSGSLFKACLVQSEHLAENGEMIYSRSVLLRDLTWRGETGVQGLPMSYSPTGNSHKLRWLFDEAPVGIVLLDLQGNVTESNRAFLKLRGIHQDSAIGRPFSEQISKEDRGDVAAQLSKVVMGIMPASHLEVRMPAMGERELIASLYASRLEDDSGDVSGLVLHFIDTTEHKNLEVQFAQSQKMQAVGQLAGGVAHDFNNLLTAMIGFSDLLLMRHGPDDPSFSDIQQIKQNANRATDLVRQLLAFSRQQELEPVILDITEALSDMSNLLGRLIGENIELQMNHERDLWLLKVDCGQFDQVIINLTVNARDAMPGGGTVSIQTGNVSVTEATQRGHEVMRADDYVLVEVSDSGVGIAKEDMPRIFEPFFSTKEVGAGTGLGLSTVYGIIHQTGGYIFVDSAPGEGTTFSIYLPRFVADEETASELETALTTIHSDEQSEGDLTGEGTVLLVEDDDAVRMFGSRALRNKGYQVLEAGDGEEALDVINSGANHKIDLIISDVVMPGMDGHTLVQLVRHEIPAIKIILTSGYSQDVFAEDVERDTSIEFLAKPFSLKDLAGKVKDVLSS